MPWNPIIEILTINALNNHQLGLRALILKVLANFTCPIIKCRSLLQNIGFYKILFPSFPHPEKFRLPSPSAMPRNRLILEYFDCCRQSKILYSLAKEAFFVSPFWREMPFRILKNREEQTRDEFCGYMRVVQVQTRNLICGMRWMLKYAYVLAPATFNSPAIKFWNSFNQQFRRRFTFMMK